MFNVAIKPRFYVQSASVNVRQMPNPDVSGEVISVPFVEARLVPVGEDGLPVNGNNTMTVTVNYELKAGESVPTGQIVEGGFDTVVS